MKPPSASDVTLATTVAGPSHSLSLRFSFLYSRHEVVNVLQSDYLSFFPGLVGLELRLLTRPPACSRVLI
jgi:hypothetical protein